MDRTVKPLLLCLAGAMLAGGVHGAITNGNLNAYTVIVERNPFGLRPPPPPAPPKIDEAPASPPPEVSLTGITSMSGKTKAWLVTKEKGKNESQYLNLTEGEKEGALEILAIDEKAGTVKIKNAGVETVLNFKDNGIKSVAMNSPAKPGGVVSMPGAGGTPMVALPPRGTDAGRAPVPLLVPGQNPAGSSASPNLQSIPTRPSRLSPNPSSQNTTVPHPYQPPMSAEESAVMLKTTEVQHQSEIKAGTFPPLPPLPE